MQMSNSSIMVCGGTGDTTNRTTCEVLHINNETQSDKWMLTKPIPANLTGGCLMAIGDKFYYCGGVNGEQVIKDCYVDRRTLELSGIAKQVNFREENN